MARWTRARVSDEMLALACHRLAGLLGCGEPLSSALLSVADDERGRARRQVWRALADHVDAGMPLSQALSLQPHTFGADMAARVRVSEADGSLAVAFEDLERLAVQRAAHRERVRAALAYPILAAIVLSLAMGFLLVKVVPLLGHGVGTGGPLERTISWHARPLWYASHVLSEPAGAIGSLVCLALLVSIAGYAGRSGRGRFGSGRIARSLELSRVAATLARLHGAGLPLDEALDIAARGCASLRRRDALLSACARLSAGARLSDALAGTHAVPDLFVRFVAAGEVAGTLDAALMRAAALHERQAMRRLASHEALIGPMVLAVFGATLCWVIVSVLLPVYEQALSGAFA